MMMVITILVCNRVTPSALVQEKKGKKEAKSTKNKENITKKKVGWAYTLFYSLLTF